MKEKYIMEQKWDYLIILDACRYDYFREVYKELLSPGKLEKTLSPAIETREWVQKNFPERYDDVIYLSTTPFVNSKKKLSTPEYTFDAKQHFYKVIDIWDGGWDEEVKTVRPKTVTNTAKKEIKKHPDKRLIIHYMQPHAPYISMKHIPQKTEKEQRKKKKKRGKTVIQKLTNLPGIYQLKMKTLGPFISTFGTEVVWKLNQKLNFRDVHPAHMEMAWRKVGKTGLRKAYLQNLKLVMKSTRELLDGMKGDIIITADHGELLGEDGLYGHGSPLPRHKKLVEIPWYTIHRKKIHENKKTKEKSEIKKIHDNIKKIKMTEKI